VARKLGSDIPRIALTPSEAAASIGVGPDFFNEHVAPELKIVRRGRKRLVPVQELEQWIARNAEPPISTKSNDHDRRHQLDGVARLKDFRLLFPSFKVGCAVRDEWNLL